MFSRIIFSLSIRFKSLSFDLLIPAPAVVIGVDDVLTTFDCVCEGGCLVTSWAGSSFVYLVPVPAVAVHVFTTFVKKSFSFPRADMSIIFIH